MMPGIQMIYILELNIISVYIIFGQIVFEGVIGTSPRGDIALDDVSILQGQCRSPGLL